MKAERLEALCRERGLPVTVQRRVIFAALLDHDDHPTVDRVFADVKNRIPGVSRTTVYRTLETLADLGTVRRTGAISTLRAWPTLKDTLTWAVSSGIPRRRKPDTPLVTWIS